MKILAKNKRVSFDYFIEDTIIGGIALQGWEVKSILAGKCSINECYARFINNELFIIGSSVTPVNNTPFDAPDPSRTRKLLLTKHQINKWNGKVKTAGYTVMVKDIHYSENRKIKATVCLCKGKQLHDKRESIKERDIKRESLRHD